MVFYHVQSWQQYDNGFSKGEEILKKEGGSALPENNMSSASGSGAVWYRNQYFTEYADARKAFDHIHQGYHKAGIRACIKLRDEVTGEQFVYEKR